MEKRVMTYLLVEDEEFVREAFREYAAAHPELICLGVVDTVEEALEVTLTKRPQAVILDLQLNDSNGEDYLIRLKKMNLKERPSVVVLTNNTDKGTQAQVAGDGAARIIRKSESRYMREGPFYVFDVLWTKYPFFEVKYSLERPLPTPVVQETLETKRERIREFCLEHGARRVGKSIKYVVYTVAAITAQKTNEYVLKEILEEVGREIGAAEHTIYIGMESCMRHMWDNPGGRSLKQEYEDRYNVRLEKDLPSLANLLAFIAERF